MLQVVEELSEPRKEVRDSIIEVLDHFRAQALLGEYDGIAIAAIKHDDGVATEVSRSLNRPGLMGSVAQLQFRMLSNGI
jgi:hypothetical protein